MVKRYSIALLFFVVLSSFLLYGQWGQVGALQGTVKTLDGTPLLGVSVTLTSPDMVIDEMVTITNESGLYRFCSLDPGDYDLRFEAKFMGTIVRQKIIVSANMTVALNIIMQFQPFEEQYVVKGKSPTIDRFSVSKNTILDSEFLNSIPAEHSFGNYFNMAPGITGDSAQGAAIRDSSFLLDGISINDPVVGLSDASFNIDILEEISVQTSGISAEHGSIKGALVNIITKRGGNNFSGSLNFYYNDFNLQSDNTQGTALERSSSGYQYDFEPGFLLGGPIVKDRLWFFSSFSVRRKASFVPGFPYDKEEDIPIKDNNIYPYMKLTFQLNQKNKFILGFSYSRREFDNANASWNVTEAATNLFTSSNFVFSGHWIHNFGYNLTTNFKIGGFRRDLAWRAKVHDASMTEDTTGIQYNSVGWDDLNHRWRFQTFFDGILFLDDVIGSHEMKFGIQSILLNGGRRVKTYGKQDGMGFHGVWQYYWEGGLYYTEFFSGFNCTVRSLNIGLFFDDTWNINKNLTLNLGIRWDYNKNYFPVQSGSIGDIPSQGNLAHIGYAEETWDLVIEKPITAFIWKNFSPRMGLIYDLFSDGSTLFKINYSKYLQDNFTSISFDLNPVSWVGYGAYMNQEGALMFVDYTWVPGVNTKVGYNDHHLETPYSIELSIGIERELWEDWSLGVRYIRRWDKKLIENVDASALDIQTLMEGGEFVWTRYVPVTVTDPYNDRNVVFWDQLWVESADLYLVNPPGADRNYKGIEIRLNKRYSKNWSMNMSYVYNKSTGLIGNEYWESEGRQNYFNNPNFHTNAYGRMPLERRHQFKCQALLKGPWGINISGYYRFLSGQPHDRWVRSIDLYQDLSTTEEVRAEPRGSYSLPDLSILDIRFEKAFKFGKRINLKLFCDIFNIFNGKNAVGVYEYSSFSNENVKFQDMIAIQDPRLFRLGAKIEF